MIRTRFDADDGVINAVTTSDTKCTPEWEYFDLRKRAPYVGSQGAGLGISVRIVPDKDGDDGGLLWKEIDILEMGEIWNILEDEIEERCKVEDAKRRRAAARKSRSPE